MGCTGCLGRDRGVVRRGLRHGLRDSHGSNRHRLRSGRGLRHRDRSSSHGGRRGTGRGLCGVGVRGRVRGLRGHVARDAAGHGGVPRARHHARALRRQSERPRRLSRSLSRSRHSHGLSRSLSLSRHSHGLNRSLNRSLNRHGHGLRVVSRTAQGRVAEHRDGGRLRSGSGGRRGSDGGRSGHGGHSGADVRCGLHDEGEELLADGEVCTHVVGSGTAAVLLKNVATEIYA